MNYHKKRLIVTAIMVLVALLLGCYGIEKLSAKPFYYNQGWLPPRTHQVCNDAFIGYEYQPRLEKRCRVLWNAWTGEINNSNSANQ